MGLKYLTRVSEPYLESLDLILFGQFFFSNHNHHLQKKKERKIRSLHIDFLVFLFFYFWVFFSGIPLVIEMDENMKYVKDYYLADEAEVKAAMERVANQGKAK